MDKKEPKKPLEKMLKRELIEEINSLNTSGKDLKKKHSAIIRDLKTIYSRETKDLNNEISELTEKLRDQKRRLNFDLDVKDSRIKDLNLELERLRKEDVIIKIYKRVSKLVKKGECYTDHLKRDGKLVLLLDILTEAMQEEVIREVCKNFSIEPKKSKPEEEEEYRSSRKSQEELMDIMFKQQMMSKMMSGESMDLGTIMQMQMQRAMQKALL